MINSKEITVFRGKRLKNCHEQIYEGTFTYVYDGYEKKSRIFDGYDLALIFLK